MAELETTEQALAYLAEVSPTETFNVHRFPRGWVCTKVLSPEEMARDAGLGTARLVIDPETAIVYQYPSWSTKRVAAAFTEFKDTGVKRAGRQIYPYQWSITMRRTVEDDQTIVYQLTAQSLTDPPESSQQFPLTIDKRTYTADPKNPLTSVAMSYAEWSSRGNQGVWPETATTHV